MAGVRNSGQFGFPTYNQARKVIARFGGEAKLASLIGVNRISVYRWQYKRPYGSDGLIPAFQIERIKAVARLEGILLRPEDWVPETVKYDAQEVERVAQHQASSKVGKPRGVADLLS